MRALLALALALALDLRFGEPRRWHPVRGMGHMLAPVRRWRGSPWWLRLAGALWVLAGGLLWFGSGWLLEHAASQLPALLGALLLAPLLKASFAVRALDQAVAGVEAHLARGDLVAARRSLGRDLVSRSTAELTAPEVAGAAIASLAENLVDSVAAPLWWYAVGGLPAALLYRWLNTADAMLGYRTGSLRWSGWAAARLDDLANWPVARLAAPLWFLAAGRTVPWRRLWREAAHTPSPNAGWGMAAVALLLGIRIEKRGVYELHAEGTAADAATIARARRHFRRTVAAVLIVAAIAIGVRTYLG